MQHAGQRRPREVAAEDGKEQDLVSLDAVVKQRILRAVNRRKEPAGGGAQRMRPGPVVRDGGRRAARVSKKSAI
jgi:hypothetical protein